ncbi:MAG: DUF4864 domain-containing protein [Kiloniellales bacterium]
MRATAVLLAGLVAILAIGAPVQAQDMTISEADRDSIRDVIERQLAAFGRDDGAQAFSYASPGIRRKFGTPENFMHMVRTGYAPVYRPRRVDFRDVVVVDGVPVQKVLIVGPDGVLVMAIYPMEKQPDGDWKIAGCVLVSVAQRAL